MRQALNKLNFSKRDDLQPKSDKSEPQPKEQINADVHSHSNNPQSAIDAESELKEEISVDNKPTMAWIQQMDDEANQFKIDPLLLDRAYGCVIGAAIGDSMGSYVEFSRDKISKEEMDLCMQMPGGGPHWVKPGQVTDDTEMAVSAARGCLDFIENWKPSEKAPIPVMNGDTVAKRYNKWFRSDPIDMGNCTASTVSFNTAETQRKAAAKFNQRCIDQYGSDGNVANGSLMRCMPIVIFGHKLNIHDLMELMIADSKLTHANEYIYIMLTSYAIAAQYLLRNPTEENRNINAFTAAFLWNQSLITDKKTPQLWIKAAKKIRQWLNDCRKAKTEAFHPATKFLGFARIAFERTFYHLYRNSDFTTAMRETIREGGDTDTNACIVGGMIGALWGLKALPRGYVMKIRDTPDDEFQAQRYFKDKLVIRLMSNAPEKIQCV